MRNTRRRLNVTGDNPCASPNCLFLAEEDRWYCCNGCGDSHGHRHSGGCAAEPAFEQNIFAASASIFPSAHPQISPTFTGSRLLFAGTPHRLSDSEGHESSGTQHAQNSLSRNDTNTFVAYSAQGQGSAFGYLVPARWTRQSESVLPYINWFLTRYEQSLDAPTQAEWMQTENAWLNLQNQREAWNAGAGRRSLIIHAYRSASPLPRDMHYIDVDSGFHCTAFGAGDLSQMTGIDFRVLAKLLTQQPIAMALKLAFYMIEMQQLSELAFLCGGGTHRSVGCAVLTVLLFYPNARLMFHTSRTRSDAAELLLPAYSFFECT